MFFGQYDVFVRHVVNGRERDLEAPVFSMSPSWSFDSDP
jgi:hypothetical protein